MKWLALLLLAVLTGCAGVEPAPRPLYRDPVLDGAADVSLVFNRGPRRWEMFYTNRRATLRLPDPKDVSWVHATPIGIATTDDGNHWRVDGQASFPAECTGATLWAPEIQDFDGVYHLWLTIVPGVHRSWTGERRIEHLTSTDLRTWQCAGRAELGSSKVIDASVIRAPQGGYRMWFKDEQGGSKLKVADSPDLTTWTVRGPVSALPGEGPTVFHFAGKWWLVADLWKGLLVLRSDDTLNWQEQPTRLLADVGLHPTDRAKGQHPGVTVVDGRWHQRTVIQVAELQLKDGWLAVDRNAPPPDLRAAFRGR